MNTSNVRTNDDPDLTRWGLIALALVTAAFLMVYYVQLLQESMSRGAQWRYVQASQLRDEQRAVAASNALLEAPRARMQLVSANR